MAELDLVSEQSDNGIPLEVADGDESADSEDNTKEIPPTLTQRMAAIRKDCAGIGKETMHMETKAGKKYTIQGHTVEAVLAGVRPLLDEHGVWVWPQLVSVDYNGNRCDVLVDFEWENLDDPKDIKVIRWGGADTDGAGKGFAKAGTNALKEHLKKMFNITDREDAKEEEDNVEYRSDEGAARAEVEEAVDQARAALAQWANTFKSSLENAQSKKEVERLARESKDQLCDKNVTPAMRTFFTELIERQKRELP